MVSVVIVNHNYGRFLVEAVESVLSQSEYLEDLTIIDNGSSDNSREILSDYQSVANVIEQENLGQGASMNRSLEIAKGDLLWFLDADDFLLPKALERATRQWKPEFSMMNGGIKPVDDAGNAFDRPLREIRHVDQGNVLPLLLKYGHYFWRPCSSNLFSRKFLEKCLPMPARDFVINADGYLFVNAPFHGEIGHIPEPVAAYRIHNANYGCRQEGLFEIRKHRIRIENALRLDKEISNGAQAASLEYEKFRALKRFNISWARAMIWKLQEAESPMPNESGFKIFSAAVRAAVSQRKFGFFDRLKRFFAITCLLAVPRFLVLRAADRSRKTAVANAPGKS